MIGHLLHHQIQTSPQNSIAFGSAPRREADSQPISLLNRPAVSQTETHSLGFLSVADTCPSSGETHWSQDKQWPNGNAGGRRLFGRRFEPRLGEEGGGAAANSSQPTRIRTADLKLCRRLHYHSTGVGCDNTVPPHCSEPSDQKLLTPPPHPPHPLSKK